MTTLQIEPMFKLRHYEGIPMNKKTFRQRLENARREQRKRDEINAQKITPYDTGKLKIGVYYVPPKQKQSDEDLMLQNLLLGDKTPFMPQLNFNLKYLFYVLLLVVFYIGASSLVSN